MRIWNYFLIFLLLVLSLVIIAIFQLPDQNLHVITCDVGQGDAILTIYKNYQILTDGGPDNSVLNCLGRHMPFWDRNIELIISSHPDSDHITGLTEVIKRYKVNKILINPIDSGTQVYRLLQDQAQSKKIEIINPKSGMGIGIDLIHIDIFNPLGINNSQLTISNKADTNKYSIVYLLTYGQFKALMLGDIPPEVSDQLSVNSNLEQVNYIKIPHHGSFNGLTQNLLEKTNPQVAVISVGKKNVWGFPSKVILKMLNDKKINVLRTDEKGNIDFITDGEMWWIKN